MEQQRAPKGKHVKREDALQRRFIEAMRSAYSDTLKWNVQATSLVPHRSRDQYRRLGYQKGTLDFTLLVQKGVYLGLVIDFKVKSSPSKEQRETAAILRKQGYCVAFTRGYQKTIEFVMLYLGLKPGEQIKQFPRKRPEVLVADQKVFNAVMTLKGVWDAQS